jgi:hypothetical protein
MATTLEGLLAKVHEEQARKASRKRTNGFTYHPDHEADWCEVYRHEGWQARVWHTVCNTCGAEQTGLEGLYEVRKHPRLPDTISKRVTAEAFAQCPDEFSLDISLQTEYTPVCLSCLVNDDALIKDLIHAQTQVDYAESEVAHSSAAGAGCEGQSLAA